MPAISIPFDLTVIEKALRLLLKAKGHTMPRQPRGPLPGHKYIWREWGTSEGRWLYYYKEDPHPNRQHGHLHVYSKRDHSVNIHHDSSHLEHSPEQAYYHRYLIGQLGLFRRKIASSSKKDVEVHFRDITGDDLFVASYNPRRKDRPVNVYYAHGKVDKGSERTSAMRLSAFERLVKGINRTVYYDDHDRPLAYAIRVRMSPEMEKEYFEVASGVRSPGKKGWSSGPRPIRLEFVADNPYVKAMGWSGEHQYFPDGEKLRKFVNKRSELLSMQENPQKGETAVEDPGIDTKGVYRKRTAELEDGSIGWTAEPRVAGMGRARIRRVLDLSSKYKSKVDKDAFLYELGLEYSELAHKVVFGVINWAVNRGANYEFYTDDVHNMVAAALGDPDSRTGLVESVDYYDPYRKFENPNTGESGGCKFITHVVPFMRKYAFIKLNEILERKKKEILSAPDRLDRYAHATGLNFEQSRHSVDEEGRLDVFQAWRVAQKRAIEEAIKVSKDVHERSKLSLALRSIPTRYEDMDRFYADLSSHEWAIPPDDYSRYLEYKPSSRGQSSASTEDLPSWGSFIADNISDRRQLGALLTVMPSGPSYDIEYKESLKMLTDSGVLDASKSEEDREKDLYGLVASGVSMLQQMDPDTMNSFYRRADSNATRKPSRSSVSEIRKAVAEEVEISRYMESL